MILRRLLGQPSALKEWKLIRTGVVSRLGEVECIRTLDRLRIEATPLALGARASGLSVVGA